MKSTFKLLLACVVLCLTSPLSAQVAPINIQKSDIFKDTKKHSELLFTADAGNGGIVLVRQYFGGLVKNPKGYLIEYYDGSLNLIRETEIEIDNSSIKNIFIKDGKVHLIEFRYNRKDKSYDYYVLEAGLNNLNFKNEQKLFSIDRKDVKKPFAMVIGFIPITNDSEIDHDPTGEVGLSANNEFIAFNFDIKDGKNESHRIIVYNDMFEQVFDKTLTEDVKDRHFQYNSFSVSDTDGSVYYLGKAYKNNTLKNRVKGEINYSYKLKKVSANDVKTADFSTKDNYVNSMGLLVNTNGVFCVGAYSEKKSFKYKGIAYFKLNPESLSIETSTFNPFTKQFLVDKYGEKKGTRKEEKGKELPHLTYRDFILSDTGEVYLNAEEYYVTVHTNMGPNGSMSTYYVYHYDDIYTCKFNNEGKLDWVRTINKKQKTTGGSTHLSFSSAVKNGNMYIFVNGAKNVKKLRDDRIQFKQKKDKKLNLYAIQVKPDGSFDYKILIDDKDSKMTYKTKQGVFNFDTHSVLFEGDRGKNKQILKLSL